MRWRRIHDSLDARQWRALAWMAAVVLVGLFVAAWILALLFWRLGRVEERWSSQLGETEAV